MLVKVKVRHCPFVVNFAYMVACLLTLFLSFFLSFSLAHAHTRTLAALQLDAYW